jgi:choline-sulfatase
MAGQNVLFIMSDEHSRHVLGAYGNTVVKTPNLDRLAAEGTVFENAYANCPICVPSRASFATGRYVHEIGYWDNAFPYTGTPPSFGHRLHEHGHRCDSIGKLHYRGSEDPNGFDNEILPLHVLDGKADIQGMLRQDPPKRTSTAQLAGDAGAGESTYLAYDRQIRDAAVAWLGRAARESAGKPWCLFVSFVCPHFPLVAPPEFYALYPLDSLPLPPCARRKNFRTTRCCASCARSRTTRTISGTKPTSVWRSPRTTAWSPSSTTISAGF